MGSVMPFLLQKLEVSASTDRKCEMRNYSPCDTSIYLPWKKMLSVKEYLRNNTNTKSIPEIINCRS